MPISYKNIPYSQLLCNQIAYDFLDILLRKELNGWDIIKFEKEILGQNTFGDKRRYSIFDVAISKMDKLDEDMPFLKFGEAGQHYAYELFLSPPKYWGSRGSPVFWTYMARQFTFDTLPIDASVFKHKYMTIVNILGIPFGKDEWTYVERFNVGGISAGTISGKFVEDALDILLYRLKKYDK